MYESQWRCSVLSPNCTRASLAVVMFQPASEQAWSSEHDNSFELHVSPLPQDEDDTVLEFKSHFLKCTRVGHSMNVS